MERSCFSFRWNFSSELPLAKWRDRKKLMCVWSTNVINCEYKNPCGTTAGMWAPNHQYHRLLLSSLHKYTDNLVGWFHSSSSCCWYFYFGKAKKNFKSMYRSQFSTFYSRLIIFTKSRKLIPFKVKQRFRLLSDSFIFTSLDMKLVNKEGKIKCLFITWRNLRNLKNLFKVDLGERLIVFCLLLESDIYRFPEPILSLCLVVKTSLMYNCKNSVSSFNERWPTFHYFAAPTGLFTITNIWTQFHITLYDTDSHILPDATVPHTAAQNKFIFERYMLLRE